MKEAPEHEASKSNMTVKCCGEALVIEDQCGKCGKYVFSPPPHPWDKWSTAHGFPTLAERKRKRMVPSNAPNR